MLKNWDWEIFFRQNFGRKSHCFVLHYGNRRVSKVRMPTIRPLPRPVSVSYPSWLLAPSHMLVVQVQMDCPGHPLWGTHPPFRREYWFFELSLWKLSQPSYQSPWPEWSIVETQTSWSDEHHSSLSLQVTDLWHLNPWLIATIDTKSSTIFGSIVGLLQT